MQLAMHLVWSVCGLVLVICIGGSVCSGSQMYSIADSVCSCTDILKSAAPIAVSLFCRCIRTAIAR